MRKETKNGKRKGRNIRKGKKEREKAKNVKRELRYSLRRGRENEGRERKMNE